MDDFELRVGLDVFSVSERRQPGGALSCDVTWLNPPIDGTHGFTISPIPDTKEAIEREVRGFLREFAAD